MRVGLLSLISSLTTSGSCPNVLLNFTTGVLDVSDTLFSLICVCVSDCVCINVAPLLESRI
jgi:hypothetical protein